MSNKAVVSGWFVDWMTAILPMSALNFAPGGLPDVMEISKLGYALVGRAFWAHDRPVNHYSDVFVNQTTGLRIGINPSRADMGVMVLADGQCLSEVGWKTLFDRLYEAGAHFTRIDITVDWEDDRFVVKRLYDDWLAGSVITKARNARYISSSTGDTVEFGRRTSGRMLRVYDKGGQSGGEPNHHFRAELEVKGEHARFLAGVLRDPPRDLARAMIQAFFKDDAYGRWVKAMATPIEFAPTLPKVQRGDTRKWLLGTVAKVIAKQTDNDMTFWNEFLSAVLKHRTQDIPF